MAVALRLAVIAPLALLLCACNQVVSSEPWFTQADTEGAPQLRNGVWVADDPDCRFDEVKPIERWPDCASAFVVRSNEWLTPVWDTQGRGRKANRFFSRWEVLPVLLAQGEPVVIQWTNEDPSDSKQESANPDTEPYHYLGMRPIQLEGTGTVTRFAMWPVECGPLPKTETAQAPSRRKPKHEGQPIAYADQAEPNVTDKPFAGLTIVQNDCVAGNQAALRNAAKLSEALGAHSPTAHWVRGGYR